MMTRRQYKWALLVLGVAGLAGGALGSWLLPSRAAWAQGETPTVLTAQGFLLVDENGKGRAALFNDGGEPSLQLYDAAGKRRAELKLWVDGSPGLALYDAAGAPRAMLTLLGAGDNPQLSLYGEGGPLSDESARLCVFSGIGPSLRLHGEGGILHDRSASLSVDSLFGSSLVLCEGSNEDQLIGKSRVSLGTYKGRPCLALADAQGHNRVVVGCTATVDKHTGATTEHPESTVTLYKANGDVIWQAP